MHTTLPTVASKVCKIPLAVLFKVAYDYAEERKHPTNKREDFEEYLRTRQCSQVVFDFSLDLLAGRVKYNPKEMTL